jgi:hypothetical protein
MKKTSVSHHLAACRRSHLIVIVIVGVVVTILATRY